MGEKNILSKPIVKTLIKTFDLQQPLRSENSLNVIDFSLEDGFIVINEVELLDINGKHIRNIEPDAAFEYIDQFVVTFRNKIE